MKPSIGRIVIHHGVQSNGEQRHPAIITRVWSDELVNLTVFPDNGFPISQTSQSLIDPNEGLIGWYWPNKVEEVKT